MFRSVAYFMLEMQATDEAITLFRRVQDLAPGEPHSFLVRAKTVELKLIARRI